MLPVDRVQSDGLSSQLVSERETQEGLLARVAEQKVQMEEPGTRLAQEE